MNLLLTNVVAMRTVETSNRRRSSLRGVGIENFSSALDEENVDREIE